MDIAIERTNANQQIPFELYDVYDVQTDCLGRQLLKHNQLDLWQKDSAVQIQYVDLSDFNFYHAYSKTPLHI